MLRQFTLALAALAASASAAQAATLKEAVVKALATNPRMQVATQNRKAVDHELREARGAYLPQVDFVAGYGAEWTNDFRTRQSGGDATVRLPRREANLKITQRVFNGFETDGRVASRKGRVREAGHEVFETAEKIAFDTAAAYLEVVRQRRTLALADGLVKVHVQTLQSLRQRRRAGVGTAADIFQTEVRLERARALRVRTMKNLRDAEARYLRMVGEAPGSVARPEFPAGAVPVGIQAALGGVRANNPNMLARKAAIQAAEGEVDVALAAFFPRVNIEADATYEEDVDGIDDNERSGRVMVRMRWNIYKGGADSANRREALSRLAEAKNRRLESLVDAEEKIRRAWNAHEAAVERVKRLTRAVDFSVRTRNAYRQQFRVAQRSLLDVLDSESELFTSRVQLLAAEINQLTASYEMLSLQGSLLKTLEIPLGPTASTEIRHFLTDLAK